MVSFRDLLNVTSRSVRQSCNHRKPYLYPDVSLGPTTRKRDFGVTFSTSEQVLALIVTTDDELGIEQSAKSRRY